MMEWLVVFLGGGMGSLARMALGKWPGNAAEGFPVGTFLANVLACLVLGTVAGFVAQRGNLHPLLRLGITAGFCGGFSTFSTFSLEAMNLFDAGRYLLMAVYVLASVALCFVGIAVGQWLGRQVGE
ncbi:MAG: fluoride efflux transporter CrcB [Bacteroidia bacterium]